MIPSGQKRKSKEMDCLPGNFTQAVCSSSVSPAPAQVKPQPSFFFLVAPGRNLSRRFFSKRVVSSGTMRRLLLLAAVFLGSCASVPLSKASFSQASPNLIPCAI
jgi:hypothetical protein